MNPKITRREFSQLFSAIFCFIAGVKLSPDAEAKDNTSYWLDRIKPELPDDLCLCERALAEEWEKWNDPKQWGGHGILQDLMISTHRHENPKNFDPWLTDRERKIVATVIQWLGTNVGRSFLDEASERMGARQYPFSEAMKLRDTTKLYQS